MEFLSDSQFMASAFLHGYPEVMVRATELCKKFQLWHPPNHMKHRSPSEADLLFTEDIP
jgi:hypothetical protein